ncbi:MAG: hypothetical protein LW768_00905 [Rubrivivax sp.]|nr:hypothetical protein [Rubrivivax sp.]
MFSAQAAFGVADMEGMTRPIRLCLAMLPLVAALSGCDLLGIETASQQAAKRDADGKAIGGACRHAARSIEQCFEQNKRADRAAVFTGWREMNDYMRENNIQPIPPAAEPPAVADAAKEAAPDGEPAPAKGRKKDS